MRDRESITLGDCEELYDKEGIRTCIEKGRITGFEEGERNEA